MQTKPKPDDSLNFRLKTQCLIQFCLCLFCNQPRRLIYRSDATLCGGNSYIEEKAVYIISVHDKTCPMGNKEPSCSIIRTCCIPLCHCYVIMEIKRCLLSWVKWSAIMWSQKNQDYTSSEGLHKYRCLFTNCIHYCTHFSNTDICHKFNNIIRNHKLTLGF